MRKVHKVYTDVLEIELHDEFKGHLACEDVNDMEDEDTHDMQLTTDDNKVTCPICLKIMWGK